MRTASNTEAGVVRVNRVHPFKLWLLNAGKTQETAAEDLGVSKFYLSAVLAGRRTPSRELYRDMAKLSRGGVTMKELEAFKKPSERPRRLQPKPRKGRGKGGKVGETPSTALH
jgi:transcriptional regulator with XRE-family HTH domain